MRSIVLAAAAAFVASSAYADMTPYQPGAPHHAYGYSESQVDWNRVRVSFAGNDDTPLERVEMYLLYRAAEATLQRGFDYFVVVDHNVETTSSFAAAGPPLPLAPRRYREDARHQAVSDIVMHRGQRPIGVANAYDARAVRANLGAAIAAR